MFTDAPKFDRLTATATRPLRSSATPVLDAGAPIAVTPWLDRLRDARPLARAGLDPEGVHRLRVAIARITVWLAFSTPTALRRELRWLRDHAAAVRDIDVLLVRKLPDSARQAVRALRRDAQRELVAALDSPRFDRLLRALAARPPVARADAQRQLARLARRACARGRAVERHRRDPIALHALRRACRRVRFALEWLGRDAGRLAALQDALGEVGDRVAGQAVLRRAKHAGHAARRSRRALKHEMRATAKVARDRWRASRRALETLARPAATRRWGAMAS